MPLTSPSEIRQVTTGSSSRGSSSSRVTRDRSSSRTRMWLTAVEVGEVGHVVRGTRRYRDVVEGVDDDLDLAPDSLATPGLVRVTRLSVRAGHGELPPVSASYARDVVSVSTIGASVRGPDGRHGARRAGPLGIPRGAPRPCALPAPDRLGPCPLARRPRRGSADTLLCAAGCRDRAPRRRGDHRGNRRAAPGRAGSRGDRRRRPRGGRPGDPRGRAGEGGPHPGRAGTARRGR